MCFTLDKKENDAKNLKQTQKQPSTKVVEPSFYKNATESQQLGVTKAFFSLQRILNVSTAASRIKEDQDDVEKKRQNENKKLKRTGSAINWKDTQKYFLK